MPFLISGIGIGFAVAPVTSAVMATAPKDRVGNASGVLSTMRQVGSLMGIAILGAVLQNQVTANITKGVEAISQIPEALKQKIIAAAAAGSMQMGGVPGGGSDMPAAAQAMIATLFKGWFTDAIASTFVVAVVLRGDRRPLRPAAAQPRHGGERGERDRRATCRDGDARGRRRAGRDGGRRGRRRLTAGRRAAAPARPGRPSPALTTPLPAPSTLGQGEARPNGE